MDFGGEREDAGDQRHRRCPRVGQRLCLGRGPQIVWVTGLVVGRGGVARSGLSFQGIREAAAPDVGVAGATGLRLHVLHDDLARQLRSVP